MKHISTQSIRPRDTVRTSFGLVVKVVHKWLDDSGMLHILGIPTKDASFEWTGRTVHCHHNGEMIEKL